MVNLYPQVRDISMFLKISKLNSIKIKSEICGCLAECFTSKMQYNSSKLTPKNLITHTITHNNSNPLFFLVILMSSIYYMFTASLVAKKQSFQFSINVGNLTSVANKQKVLGP